MCIVSLVESGEGFSDFLSSQLLAFIAPQPVIEDRLRFSVPYTVVYGHSCRIFELLVADRSPFSSRADLLICLLISAGISYYIS